MEFFVPQKSLDEVKQKLLEQLAQVSVPVDISFEIQESQLEVEISKWGTSRLSFISHPHFVDEAEGLVLTLQKQDIATAHRAFAETMEKVLEELVNKVGGQKLS